MTSLICGREDDESEDLSERGRLCGIDLWMWMSRECVCDYYARTVQNIFISQRPHSALTLDKLKLTILSPASLASQTQSSQYPIKNITSHTFASSNPSALRISLSPRTTRHISPHHQRALHALLFLALTRPSRCQRRAGWVAAAQPTQRHTSEDRSGRPCLRPPSWRCAPRPGGARGAPPERGCGHSRRASRRGYETGHPGRCCSSATRAARRKGWPRRR